MNKAETGLLGEDFAAEYYKKLGFTVTHRNYHSRYGEIDLIAENGEFTVFVEVKTRKDDSYSRPGEAVDRRKQRKLILTAEKYLSEKDTFTQPRFDVFEVWQDGGRIIRYNLIENAFSAEDFGGQYEIF